MRLKPLADRVIIKRIQQELSAGGIALPDPKDRNRDARGIVLAIGPGEKTKYGRRPMSVKVGDEVFLGRHPFIEVMFDGEVLIVAHEDDVAAVIKPLETSDAGSHAELAQSAA